MSSIREATSPVEQGEDESIYYTIDTTNWGGSPSSVSYVVKDVYNSNLDVTSSVSTGSATVSGDDITLPRIHGLTVGRKYRVEVKFTSGGNTLEPYFFIEART